VQEAEPVQCAGILCEFAPVPDWHGSLRQRGFCRVGERGRFFLDEPDLGLRWTDLSRQRIKLLGERHRCGAIDRELSLANHAHELDASEHIGGDAKRLETQHWRGHALRRTMILLDDVVEVLDLAYGDRSSHSAVDLVDGGLVGATFIHHDLLRRAILTHSLMKEPLGGGHVTVRREEEVDGPTFLVDGAVEILLDALDLDVRLVHPPATADRALVLA
jgi:hypothetical protein